VDRGWDYDHFIITLLTFWIAAEVLAAAAILLFGAVQASHQFRAGVDLAVAATKVEVPSS